MVKVLHDCKELYIKGNEKDIDEVIEFARKRFGKGRISVMNVLPRIAPDEPCSCGGEYHIICEDCGDDYEEREEGD